ncbi:hypothetical protein PG997_010735 [Apiospora hydei]|uniref:Uncharacterized protein n=1 Tax=Apiospora hydei TaxID=1337664 RepID=A0ABR1VH43_9PEZI
MKSEAQAIVTDDGDDLEIIKTLSKKAKTSSAEKEDGLVHMSDIKEQIHELPVFFEACMKSAKMLVKEVTSAMNWTAYHDHFSFKSERASKDAFAFIYKKHGNVQNAIVSCFGTPSKTANGDADPDNSDPATPKPKTKSAARADDKDIDDDDDDDDHEGFATPGKKLACFEEAPKVVEPEVEGDAGLTDGDVRGDSPLGDVITPP